MHTCTSLIRGNTIAA